MGSLKIISSFDKSSKAREFFFSETDSEVLAQLIARESADNLFDQVLQGLKHVRGAYAIAVLAAREPDAIVVAKNASPLVLGTLEGLQFSRLISRPSFRSHEM